MSKAKTVETLVIDNFSGSMTAYLEGDINSGRSYVQTSSGQNPFVKAGNLTWMVSAEQINVGEDIITDLIMAGKVRVESGILYVYSIGHTGRLYKIQVNDPTTFNPDYDNPVLLTTLTDGSPTFTRGGSIDFFGATEQLYIGHDKGVTRINFDGTSESAISGTWTQTVPRPLKQFLGKLYIGNGSNIAEIDSTGTVTSSTKLSPGFPTNSQVRDMDVSIDGNYLETVVSTVALYDLTSATQETTTTANASGFIFKWNGTDVGYTAFTSFPSYSLSANIAFQNYQYTFGSDQYGSAVYAPYEKILFLPEGPPALPNAIASTGNQLFWMTPLYFNGALEAELFCWGSTDFEIGQPLGWWDLYFQLPNEGDVDVACIPLFMSVSNSGLGASSNGYPGNAFGTSKFYFSTMETDGPDANYRLYKWKMNTTLSLANEGIPIAEGVYQTQSQLFSKKVLVSEVRVYGEPWVSGNSFRIDLMGSSGGEGVAIPNGSMTFTAGSNLTIGDDFAWYKPSIAPTYALGAMITNLGDVNFTINKIEIDYTAGGK